MKHIYKLLILLIAFLCVSCSENGELEIDLSKEYQEFSLQAKSKHTTDAFISCSGKCDCKVKVDILGKYRCDFDSGNIEFGKWMEWYTSPRIIKIYSKGCSEESKFTFKYKFIHGLF